MPLVATIATVACLACIDRTPTAAVAPPEPRGTEQIVGHLTCHGMPVSGVLECTTGTSGSDRRVIYGQTQVKLTSSNVHYDSTTQTFAFDVNVKNLLAQPLGTTTGLDTVGLKVFFETGPSATVYSSPGDTGSVFVRNGAGYQNFTAANQPYFQYRQILLPDSVSPNQRWELHCATTVTSFSFTLRVFTRTQFDPTVPVVAPDSVPNRIYNPQNYISSSDRMAGTFLKDIIVVEFASTATQEERQSAVNAVRGTVVGGYHFSGEVDGQYYIRLPISATEDTLWNAIGLLRGLPQVESADPEVVDASEAHFLLPADDSAEFRSWRLDADSADGYNWGLEAIQAPMAWGCATGQDSTPIAVVDRSFQDLPDLRPNVNQTLSRIPATPSDSIAHGSQSAAIIAARGDNQTGISGVMWHANLRFYEIFDTTQVIRRDSLGQALSTTRDDFAGIARAARNGARVIAYGRGIHWTHKPGLQATFTADTAAVNRDYRTMRTRLRLLEQDGIRPLFVFTAGNDSIDAKWSASALLKRDWANRILVVGAAENTDLWNQTHVTPKFRKAPYSNWGSLVDVYAPGTYVRSLKSSGKSWFSGTSAAGPLVAGVAGLLVDFDPRLSASQVKDLIVGGAVRGNRRVANDQTGTDSLYLVNAYESLRLAAQRPGAPLCGSRVVGQNGSLMVLRDSATGRTETIVSDADTVWEVNPMHGGKRIIVATGQDYLYHEYRWQPNGTWTLGPDPNDDVPPRSAGTALSWLGRSHGYTTGTKLTDTLATISNIAGNDSSSTYRVAFRAGTGSGSATYATADFNVVRYHTGDSRLVSYCAYRYTGASNTPTSTRGREAWTSYENESLGLASDPCWNHTAYNPEWRIENVPGVAYSPRGDSAYVVVNYQHGVENPPQFAGCDRNIVFRWDDDGPGVDSAVVQLHFTCGNGSGKRWTDGRTVYAIQIPRSGVAGSFNQRQIWNEPLANINYFAVAENGREWAADYTQDTVSYWFVGTNPPIPSVAEYDHRTCTTRYQNLNTGASIWTVPACNLWTGGFTSGMSPLRASSSLMFTQAEVHSALGSRREHVLAPGREIRAAGVVMWRAWSNQKPEILRQFSSPGVIRTPIIRPRK